MNVTSMVRPAQQRGRDDTVGHPARSFLEEQVITRIVHPAASRKISDTGSMMEIVSMVRAPHSLLTARCLSQSSRGMHDLGERAGTPHPQHGGREQPSTATRGCWRREPANARCHLAEDHRLYIQSV